MKKIVLLLLSIIIIYSCGQNSDSNAIAALEEKLESSKDPKDAEALLAAYNAHLEDHPDDMMNARYLYRSASTMWRMNRFGTATEHLKRAITAYYSSDNTPKAAELLSETYDAKLDNHGAATSVRQAMLTAFPDYENIDKIKEKMTADTVDFDGRMVQMSRDMFNATTGRINYRTANDFILNCELFTMVDPSGEANPRWLHRAAETARSIKNFDKAIELYKIIYTNYPDSDRAPQAMFLHGFTLDNDLGSFEEAKLMYDTFLEKYPDNDFADDAQFLLDNLGKSEEELIRSFEKK